MKDSEEQALEYLASLGFAEIVYEPDGNVPPDFLLNGVIAVEARRLNQHITGRSGKKVGLETDRYNLHFCLSKCLASLGPPISGRSWFVMYEFERPLPPLPVVSRAVRDVLVPFRDGKASQTTYVIGGAITLFLHPSSKALSDCFVIGSSRDGDSGGWLGGLLQENVEICVKEKTQKVANYRGRYREWWLILVDQIGYGHREKIDIVHNWDKVVIVNSQNPLDSYTL